MTKNLITRKKFFSIEKGNPYRTRKIKIEGKLIRPTLIEIKVRQTDWTLKRKVDEQEQSYSIDAEYDYVGLINFLYKDLEHIKNFISLVENWIDGKKLSYYYQYEAKCNELHSTE